MAEDQVKAPQARAAKGGRGGSAAVAPAPAPAPQASKDAAGTQGNNQRRRRRRRNTRNPNLPPQPGQVTNATNIPTVAAPSKRGQKRPLAAPRIGVGCIVMRGDELLLVRERGRWSLPKGGLETGELVQDGVRVQVERA